MGKVEIMHGDQYGLPFLIKRDGVIAPENTISDIEIIINNLTKRKIDGEVVYDSTSQRWIFPLSEEETYSLKKGNIKAQIRVKFTDNVVIGKSIPSIQVIQSLSEVIL